LTKTYEDITKTLLRPYEEREPNEEADDVTTTSIRQKVDGKLRPTAYIADDIIARAVFLCLYVDQIQGSINEGRYAPSTTRPLAIPLPHTNEETEEKTEETTKTGWEAEKDKRTLCMPTIDMHPVLGHMRYCLRRQAFYDATRYCPTTKRGISGLRRTRSTYE